MISTNNGIASALVLLGSLGAATLISRTATAEQPSAADVDRWIAELGDDNYPTRKAAAERLATGGYAAHAALAKAAEGTDPEIRTSARRLLTLIDDSEFNRRLAEFGWSGTPPIQLCDRQARQLRHGRWYRFMNAEDFMTNLAGVLVSLTRGPPRC